MIKAFARYKITFPEREIKELDRLSHLELEEKTFDKVIEGFFVTKEELEQFVPKAEVEQLQREAYEKALDDINCYGRVCDWERPKFEDYKASKSKEKTE